MLWYSSGRSRGGARGAWAPLILGKKDEMTERRKAGRASKTKLPPPPHPLLSSRSGSATVLPDTIRCSAVCINELMVFFLH